MSGSDKFVRNLCSSLFDIAVWLSGSVEQNPEIHFHVNFIFRKFEIFSAKAMELVKFGILNATITSHVVVVGQVDGFS